MIRTPHNFMCPQSDHYDLFWTFPDPPPCHPISVQADGTTHSVLLRTLPLTVCLMFCSTFRPSSPATSSPGSCAPFSVPVAFSLSSVWFRLTTWSSWWTQAPWSIVLSGGLSSSRQGHGGQAGSWPQDLGRCLPRVGSSLEDAGKFLIASSHGFV